MLQRFMVSLSLPLQMSHFAVATVIRVKSSAEHGVGGFPIGILIERWILRPGRAFVFEESFSRE